MNKLIVFIAYILYTFALPLFGQQNHVNIDWDPQRNKEGITPFSARVISPEVHDDHTVTFRLMGPDVNSVTVSGSMFVGDEAGKRVPLIKGADGVWSVTIGPLAPDIYLYWMQIDGVNMADPNNTFTGHAAMPAFSMLWVQGDGPAFYDAKDVPHGTITQHFYHSPVTNGERYLLVYTPPGYDPAKKYPVLYLMGGSGDLPETWTMHGQANFIMDNLMAEGKVKPMLIVIPNNQVVNRMHPQHTELSFPLLEREYKEVIIPYIEGRYNVIRDKHSRAIAGLSMGGRHAQYVGLRNLDLFGSVGIFSAAISVDETPVLRDKDFNSKIDDLFLGAGTYETNSKARHQVLHDELDKMGVKHEYLVGSRGAHDLITWRFLLRHFLQNLWRNPGAQTEKQLVIGEQPVYKVARAKGPITADGKMDEATWKDAEVRSFDYFFRRDEPLEKQKTKFRMLWDDANLYLFYEMEDVSLTAREKEPDGRPYLDDCAEFFCLPVPDSLYMHYGFEVNLWKAKYDYIVLWQFYKNRTIFIPDFNPEYEVGVTYDGTINNDTDIDKGWTMEFIIPLKVFRGFNTRNLTGTRWAFQAVRQDRNKVDDRFRSTSTLFPTYDVMLDVHPPYRFGLMEFTGN